MTGENWTHDDSVVVETLLQLRHSKKSDASPLKLKWSVRQRRSKKGEQTRASPSTPLSWSGATSLSLDDSPDTFRSKISQTTLFKRSRKKKTLAELKSDEMLLLKERKALKNEVASMHDLVEQQRARNNALKKMMKVVTPPLSESQSDLSCKLGLEQASSFLLPDLNMPLDPPSSLLNGQP